MIDSVPGSVDHTAPSPGVALTLTRSPESANTIPPLQSVATSGSLRIPRCLLLRRDTKCNGNERPDVFGRFTAVT